jgi:hypothetical protein
MEMTTQLSLSAVSTDEDNIKIIRDAGYTSIFDIARQSEEAFCQQLIDSLPVRAKSIHALAKQRVDGLNSIMRAYSARNEPILQRLPKLGINPFPAALAAAMERSLGGAPDFSDLFPERSEDGYADATSIQSLFSPGRYLTELYKIAKGLHVATSPLNIDMRRPDIKNLVLSETNMQEVSTLDILIDVLLAAPQRGAEVLSAPTAPIAAKAGSAPVVTDVAITGTFAVGQTLRVTYTYSDADNDAEGDSIYASAMLGRVRTGRVRQQRPAGANLPALLH